MATIEQAIYDIVRLVLDVPGELTLEHEFVNDLGANSLDVTEIAMRIERHFHIQVPEEAAEGVRTVGDVVDYVRKRLADAGPSAPPAAPASSTTAPPATVTAPTTTRVSIGSDHAGYRLKEALKATLKKLGYTVDDCGAHGPASCDYPSFALAVAGAVSRGESRFGVLVCATGIGMSIAANKVAGVRAALIHNPYEAEATRRHNDANVVCFGANIVGEGIAAAALERFASTPFEAGDDGRHRRRVELITHFEDSNKP